MARAAGVVAFIALFLFVGLKGCAISTWSPPTEMETYAVVGGDKRTLAMILMPRGYAYFVYLDPEKQYVEQILTRMSGTYAVNYVWNVWNIDRGGSSPLGLRIYGDGVTPVLIEADIIDKLVVGGEARRPSFLNKGDTMTPTLLFSKDAVDFEGMPLTKRTNGVIDMTILQKNLPVPE